MFQLKKIVRVLIITILVGLVGFGSPVQAAEQSEKITIWTTQDIGTSTYTLAATFADAFMKKTNMRVRILPTTSDVARLLPVINGKADVVWLTGIPAFDSFVGRNAFNGYKLGPQSLMQIWSPVTPGGMSLIAAKDANINTVADLKGKRVAYVVGSPAVQELIHAYLAFANLTVKDVKLINVPSVGSNYKAIVEGNADAGVSSAGASGSYEIINSPRGGNYPEFPASETEGWKRIRKTVPVAVPVTGPIGAGLKPGNNLTILTYPSPVLAVRQNADENEVYLLVKTLHTEYEKYKGQNTDFVSWEIKKVVKTDNMIYPYHPGAVKYFKEIGLWNDDLNNKQKEKVDDQKKLHNEFEKAKAEGSAKNMTDENFIKFWKEKVHSLLSISSNI